MDEAVAGCRAGRCLRRGGKGQGVDALVCVDIERLKEQTIEKDYIVRINKAIKNMRAAGLLSEEIRRYSRCLAPEAMK
jgi:hypothetical protein